jgi:hypothetical protein
VVAVAVATTSRGRRWARAADAPLARLLLASLGRTADAGVEYRVYAAYDAGDLFYARPRRRAALQTWFQAAVAAPLRARGVLARLALVQFGNALRRPGPAANFATAAAVADGAEYVLHADDDTQLETPWAARSGPGRGPPGPAEPTPTRARPRPRPRRRPRTATAGR